MIDKFYYGCTTDKSSCSGNSDQTISCCWDDEYEYEYDEYDEYDDEYDEYDEYDDEYDDDEYDDDGYDDDDDDSDDDLTIMIDDVDGMEGASMMIDHSSVQFSIVRTSTLIGFEYALQGTTRRGSNESQQKGLHLQKYDIYDGDPGGGDDDDEDRDGDDGDDDEDQHPPSLSYHHHHHLYHINSHNISLICTHQRQY